MWNLMTSPESDIQLPFHFYFPNAIKWKWMKMLHLLFVKGCCGYHSIIYFYFLLALHLTQVLLNLLIFFC